MTTVMNSLRNSCSPAGAVIHVRRRLAFPLLRHPSVCNWFERYLSPSICHLSVFVWMVMGGVLSAGAAAPTLRAISPSPGNIQLLWTPPAGDRVGYLIEKKINNEYEEVARVSASATTWLDGGLGIGRSYAYRVRGFQYDLTQVSSSATDIKHTIIQAMVKGEVSNEASATVVTVDDAALSGKIHYVKAGASGTKNGTDWANAWTDVPLHLQRGHTYYVGSGLYGQDSRDENALCRFNDPENANDFIFIKKAVPSNHGSDKGWNVDYGNGQAIFEQSTGNKNIIIFETGYYDIDGQIGERDGAVAQHGFKFIVPAGKSGGIIVQTYDRTHSGKVKSFINLRHCELQHRGCDIFVVGGNFRVANPVGTGGAGDRISVPDASIFNKNGATRVKMASTGALPAGLTPGKGWTGTEYFARDMNTTDNTIRLVSVATGKAITGMDASVGSHTFSLRMGGQCFEAYTPVQDILLQYCHIHDVSGKMVAFDGGFSTVEYCYIARNHSDPVDHGSGIRTSGISGKDNYRIVRYNILEDIEGTAYIKGGDYWEIYGNIFQQTTHFPNPGQGSLDTTPNTTAVGWGIFGGAGVNPPQGNYNLVVNNTIYRVNHGSNSNAGLTFMRSNLVGNVAFNNMWVDCGAIGLDFPKVISDYNYYCNNARTPKTDGAKGPNELHSCKGTSDPFVNSSKYDLHLSKNTEAGLALPSPYNRDMDGNVRGAGGIWSKGALQYVKPTK